MKQISQHILLWIVSLSILNSSIDVADVADPVITNQSASAVPEFEEIESITEYVMENAFDESLPDQKGNEQSGLIKKSASLDFFVPERKSKINFNSFTDNTGNKNSSHYTVQLSAGFQTILTPPPNITA